MEVLPMNHYLSNNFNDFSKMLAPFFLDDFKYEDAHPSFRLDTDIKENENEYVFEVEIPGSKKEDIALDYKDGYLTISATRVREENAKYLHHERYFGKSSRSYYVGEVDKEDIKAKYENGILTVFVPKEDKKKIAEAHSIAIN